MSELSEFLHLALIFIIALLISIDRKLRLNVRATQRKIDNSVESAKPKDL